MSGGIVPAGPELEPKIKLIAAKLSKMQKNAADEFLKKLLNSARASEVFFADPNDMFYPYFLQQLTQFRNDSKLAEATIAAAASSTAPGAAPSAVSASATTTTTTSTGTVVRSGGSVNEELLRRLEIEAKQCMEDPHPDVYEINRDGSAVELVPRTFSFMSLTAQYVAKFGTAFLEAVRRKHGDADVFRFLRSDDPRHVIFKELELSYQTILCSSDEEVEDRLEMCGNTNAFLKMCEEKSVFLRAEIARKKARMLTDDELRRRLEWDAFTVVHTFTVKDLGLEARAAQLSAAAAAAAASAAATPVAAGAVGGARYLAPPQQYAAPTTFMNAAFTHSTATPNANSSSSGPSAAAPRFLQPPPHVAGGGMAVPAAAAPRFIQPPSMASSSVSDEESYVAKIAAPHARGTMQYVVDRETGEKVHISALNEHGYAILKEGGAKRGRETDEAVTLATDDEYERNVMRRVRGDTA